MSQPGDGPLSGYRIGVTAARKVDEQVALLERRGAEVEVAPALSLDPHRVDDDSLRAATEAVLTHPVDLFLATTGIGMRAWFEAADRWGLLEALLARIGEAEILARGPKSVGALRRYGLRELWAPASEEFEDVLDHLRGRDLTGRRIVVQEHGQSLSMVGHALRRRGADVTTVSVYRVVVAEDLEPVFGLIDQIAERRLDAVTFTSAPAVAALMDAAGSTGRRDEVVTAFQADVVASCVGPVTSAAFELWGVPTIFPERSRLAAMVKQLETELPSRREGLALELASGHQLLLHGDERPRRRRRGAALARPGLGAAGAGQQPRQRGLATGAAGDAAQRHRRQRARRGDGRRPAARRAGHPRRADRGRAGLPAGRRMSSQAAPDPAARLVTVAHGTRKATGNLVAVEITRLAAERLQVEAVTSYVELCDPLLTEVLAASAGPDRGAAAAALDRLPPAPGPARGAVAGAGGPVVLGRSLGPHALLADAQVDQLQRVGATPGSPLVMVAAGSSDALATRDLDRAAELLGRAWGGPVRLATLSGLGRRPEEVVRAGDCVSSYLLAPGFFADRAARVAREAGAARVAEAIGPHERVVELVVRRTRALLSVDGTGVRDSRAARPLG